MIAKIFKIFSFIPKNKKETYKVTEIKFTTKKKEIKFVLNLYFSKKIKFFDFDIIDEILKIPFKINNDVKTDSNG
jgi:hypothetical protein